MKTIQKKLVLSIALTGFLGVGGSVLANEAPISLTDAQMDQIVAGALVSSTTTYTYFHGYSNNPANAGDEGISTYATTTQQWCHGASTTCNFNAQYTIVIGPTLISGPGF